jgi:hypothetical protein
MTLPPGKATMATVTTTGSAPVLRTDFSDQQVWLAVRAAIVAPGEGDGFLADVEFADAVQADGVYRDF